MSTKVFSTDKYIEVIIGDVVKVSGFTPPLRMVGFWDLGGPWSFIGIVRKNSRNKYIIDPNINGIINQPSWKLRDSISEKDKLVILNHYTL